MGPCVFSDTFDDCERDVSLYEPPFNKFVKFTVGFINKLILLYMISHTFYDLYLFFASSWLDVDYLAVYNEIFQRMAFQMAVAIWLFYPPHQSDNAIICIMSNIVVSSLNIFGGFIFFQLAQIFNVLMEKILNDFYRDMVIHTIDNEKFAYYAIILPYFCWLGMISFTWIVNLNHLMMIVTFEGSPLPNPEW